MRFEHLIQINDPLFPLLDFLTRAQVWRGLVARCERPVGFLPGLEGASIDARSDLHGVTLLERTLDFGSFAVHDRVRLRPMVEVLTTVAAGAGWAASRLRITIEEPAPDLLFLRFVYESDEVDDDDPTASVTRALRRQAYERSDIDTVIRIRQLAQEGALG